MRVPGGTPGLSAAVAGVGPAHGVRAAVQPAAKPVPVGELDIGFNSVGLQPGTNLTSVGTATSVGIQKTGKIVVAGTRSQGGDTVFAVVRYNTDGTFDATFGPKGSNGVVTVAPGKDNEAHAIAIQADDKIVVAGESTVPFQCDGKPDEDGKTFAIVRLTANGMLDGSFGAGGKVTPQFASGVDPFPDFCGAIYSWANAVAVQANGRIVVAGRSETSPSFAAYSTFGVLRLLANGSLDTSFNPAGLEPGTLKTQFPDGSEAQARAVTVDSFGTIFVGGWSYQTPCCPNQFTLARYSSVGGLLGTTFTPISSGENELTALAMQGAKVIAVGWNDNGPTSNIEWVATRYNASSGQLDNTFGQAGIRRLLTGATESGKARAVAIQSDGRIVLAGDMTGPDFSVDFALMRLSKDGALDKNFGTKGVITTSIGEGHSSATGVAIQSDGKVVLAGSASSVFGSAFAVARYVVKTAPDGTGEVTEQPQAIRYGTKGNTIVFTFEAAPGGLRNGTLTITVPKGWSAPSTGNRAAGRVTASLGKVSVKGRVVTVARLTLAGGQTVDIIYGSKSGGGPGATAPPKPTGDEWLFRERSTPSGKLTPLPVSPTLPAAGPGDLDGLFGVGGVAIARLASGDDWALAVAAQPDGKIVIGGPALTGDKGVFALARFKPDGSLDGSFGKGGKVTTAIGKSNDGIAAIALQPDGKIVGGGWSYTGKQWVFALARYTTKGELDKSFGKGGKVTTAIGKSDDAIMAIALQPDGKIVAAGYSYTGKQWVFALARYTTKGELDKSFGKGGKVTTAIGKSDDVIRGIVIQPDGKIVAAGYSDNGKNYDFALARYTTGGDLDKSFGKGGRVKTAIGKSDERIHGIARQPDGKIVVGGWSYTGTAWVFALARYTTTGVLDRSFGKSGKVTTAIGKSDDVIRGIVIQPDGKIIAAGYSSDGVLYAFALARYTVQGALDKSFGKGGKVTTAIGLGHAFAYAVVLAPNGMIVAAGTAWLGTDYDFAIARYLAVK